MIWAAVKLNDQVIYGKSCVRVLNEQKTLTSSPSLAVHYNAFVKLHYCSVRVHLSLVGNMKVLFLFFTKTKANQLSKPLETDMSLLLPLKEGSTFV